MLYQAQSAFGSYPGKGEAHISAAVYRVCIQEMNIFINLLDGQLFWCNEFIELVKIYIPFHIQQVRDTILMLIE